MKKFLFLLMSIFFCCQFAYSKVGHSMFWNLTSNVLIFDNYEVIVHKDSNEDHNLAFYLTAMKRNKRSSYGSETFEERKNYHLLYAKKIVPLTAIIRENTAVLRPKRTFLHYNAVQKAFEYLSVRIGHRHPAYLHERTRNLVASNSTSLQLVEPVPDKLLSNFFFSVKKTLNREVFSMKKRKLSAALDIVSITDSSANFLKGYIRVPSNVNIEAFRSVFEEVLGEAVHKFDGSTEKEANEFGDSTELIFRQLEQGQQ